MLLISFKLLRFIFDLTQPKCVLIVLISNLILDILSCIFLIPPPAPLICLNVVESWGISGWGWAHATCYCGNGMSLSFCSYLSLGLSNCRTPFTLKIFIFFMGFFSRSYFTLTWLMNLPSSSCHRATWGVLLNSHMKEAYHCCNISSCLQW